MRDQQDAHTHREQSHKRDWLLRNWLHRRLVKETPVVADARHVPALALAWTLLVAEPERLVAQLVVSPVQRKRTDDWCLTRLSAEHCPVCKRERHPERAIPHQVRPGARRRTLDPFWCSGGVTQCANGMDAARVDGAGMLRSHPQPKGATVRPAQPARKVPRLPSPDGAEDELRHPQPQVGAQLTTFNLASGQNQPRNGAASADAARSARGLTRV